MEGEKYGRTLTPIGVGPGKKPEPCLFKEEPGPLKHCSLLEPWVHGK